MDQNALLTEIKYCPMMKFAFGDCHLDISGAETTLALFSKCTFFFENKNNYKVLFKRNRQSFFVVFFFPLLELFCQLFVSHAYSH